MRILSLFVFVMVSFGVSFSIIEHSFAQNVWLPTNTKAVDTKKETSDPIIPSLNNNDAVSANIVPGGYLSNGSNPTNDPQQAMMEKLRAQGIMPRPAPAPSQQIQAWIDQQNKKYELPPTILDEPQYTIPTDYLKGLPNTLIVQNASSYIWGASDVSVITRMLGYAPQQIPQHCQLRFSGFLTTDKAMSMMQVFAGQQTAVKYDGVIKSLALSPMAICDIPSSALPPKGGIIMKIGNKYGIALMHQISCPEPTTKATQLSVQYAGDNPTVCQYH